jgi:3'-phosphoadenosine 5'-phosphosulfate sulfotransferase (PAPS reductase)/FAD synthetase
MTMQRVKAWYDYWDGNVYVSISGGKDSQVLAHIVKEMYPNVPLVFIDTGLEHNSVRLMGTELADRILRPEMRFDEVIKEYGYPIISKEVAKRVQEYRNADKKGVLETSTAYKEFNGIRVCEDGSKSAYNKNKYKFLVDAPFRISHKCCIVNKEGVARSYEKTTGYTPFLGTLASESRARKKLWLEHGCNAFTKSNPSSQPLSFWTEQDILQYIKDNSLEIAEIYGEVIEEGGKLKTTGASRTGCVFCMFGIGEDTERFLRLKESEPKKYDYVMRGGKFDETGMWVPDKGLGYKFVIDWLNEHGNMGIKY